MTPEDLHKAAELLDIAANAVNPPAPTMMRLAAGLRAMADAEPVNAKHIAFDYLDNGALVATYALCVKEKIAPKLYTTPQRPQWTGLTQLEISEGVTENRCGLTSGQFPDVAFMKGVRFAEKAMRAKNGGAA